MARWLKGLLQVSTLSTYFEYSSSYSVDIFKVCSDKSAAGLRSIVNKRVRKRAAIRVLRRSIENTSTIYLITFFSAIANGQPGFLLRRDYHIWTNFVADSKYTSIVLTKS